MANAPGSGGSGGQAACPPTVSEDNAKNIKAAADASSKLTETFREQYRIMQDLQSSVEKFSQTVQRNSNDMTSGQSAVNKGTQTASRKLKDQESAFKKVNEAAKNTAGTMKGTFSKSVDIAGAAMAGLIKGFSNFVALGKGIVGVVGKLVGGFFSVGKAILAIPFKMMQGLFEMAENGGGGTELAQAYENVREQFGDLKTGIGKSVIDVANSMGKLDDTGVSAQRIFGNLAQRTEAMNKLAVGLGQTLNQFGKEFSQSGEAIARFQRGLGMSEEQVQDVARMATRQGTSMEKVFVSVTKQTDALSKSLGINAKMMRRDMAKAMADTAHFAHLSNKEMAVAVAYANKLGLSIDKLTASMDATATFDQAAEQMGRLNETFGTNIDATEVMMAQSPAEKFELIRKSLLATGKDMTKLNYQERMLLKQQTGWDDAALDAAVSSKNFGVSLGKIETQAAKAENTTMSMTEALKNLSTEITRIVDAGPQSKGGIFDRFLDGMNKGLQSTPEFLKLMRNIKMVFADSYMSGMKLGKMLFYMVPGFKNIIDGLGDLFDPKRFHKFFDGIIKSFEIFKKKGNVSFEDFMELIKKNFWDFFDKEKGPGKKVIEGFGKFFDFFIKAFSSVAVYAVEELSKIINYVAEWIKNPKMPKVEGGGKWEMILQPLVKVFDTAVEKLWPAIKNLASALLTKLKEALTSSIGKGILAGSLAIILGPAIINTVGALAKGGIFSKAGEAAAKAASSQMGGPMGAAGAGGAGKDIGAIATETATNAVKEAGKEQAGMASSPSKMMSSAIPDKETLKRMEDATKSDVDWPKLTKFLVGIAAVFTIGMTAFAAALALVKNQKTEDIVKAGIVMAAMIPMLAGAGYLAKSLAEIENFDFKNVMKALGAVGIFMAALIPFSYVAIKSLGKLDAAEAAKTAFILGAFTAIFVGVEIAVAGAAGVGKLIDKVGVGKLIAGIVAAGLTLVAITGIAWVAIKGLGDFTKGQIVKTGAAMAMMEVMFAGAELLVLGAIGLGTLMLASGGLGAAAAGAGLLAVGVMIAAVGALAYGAIKALGGFSLGQTARTAAAMGAMEVLMAGAGLLVLEAMAVGAASILGGPLILVGMVAMGAAIYAITKVAAKTIELLGDIPIESTGRTMAVMGMAATMFTGAGALIASAGAVGAGIIASFGIGAVAIEVGLLALTDGIEVISEAALDTIEAMSEISESPSIIEGKAKAFNISVDSVTKMASTVAGIVHELDFGMFSDPIGEKIDKAANFINQLIAGKNADGTGGIIGIVNSVTKAVKDVPADQLEAGKAFASIISEISKMIDAVTKPAMELVKKADGFFGIDEKELGKLMGHVSNFFGKIGGSVKDVIQGVLSTMGSSLKGMSKEQLESMSSVGGVLKSIVDIVTAVGSAMSNKNVGDVKVGAMATATINITNSVPSIGKMMEELAKSAPELISNVIDLTRKVPTGKDFNERVKTLTDVIDMFSKMMKTISDIGSGGKQNQAPIQTFTDGMLGMRDVLMMLAGDYPGNKDVGLQNLIDFVQKIPIPKGGISEKGKLISSTLESITGIAKAIQDPLAGASKETGNIGLYIVGVLGNAHGVLSVLAGTAYSMNKVSLKDLSELIQKVSTSLKMPPAVIVMTANNIANTLKAITSILTEVNNLPKSTVENPGKDLMEKMKNVGTTLGYLFESSESPGLSTLVDGIQAIQKTLPMGYATTVKMITTQLTGLLTEINNIMTAVEGVKLGVESKDIEKNLTNINTVMENMVNTKSASSITKVVDSLNSMAFLTKGAPAKDVSAGLTTLLGNLKQVTETLSSMQSVDVNKIDENLANVKSVVTKLSTGGEAGLLGNIKGIKDKGFSPNIKAAQELLAQSKQLDSLLQSLPKLEFSAKLQTLADGLGLGGKFNYTIGPNKPVVINIAMHVYMDAAEVEKAVVHRSNSVIRDRINFALGGGQGKNEVLPSSLTVGNKNPTPYATNVTG